MSSTDAFSSTASADGAPDAQDLTSLAWVIDALRASLDSAVQQILMCVPEAGPSAPDAAAFEVARQALHQAGGALELINQSAPALLVHGMEAAVLRLAQDAALCTQDAAQALDRARQALLTYLDTLLAGRRCSAVALFPYYLAVQALAGNDKVHPADLWPFDWQMREPEWRDSTAPLPYGPQARALLDAGVLGMVKSGDAQAAAQMRTVCQGLVAAQTDPAARTFWKIAAGFFDAWVHGLVKPDVYAKRVASRVLLQYAAMAKGNTTLPERLTHDLLFFCAQAQPPAQGSEAPLLRAVRQTFGLDRHPPVDYEQPDLAGLDPVTPTPSPDPAVPPLALVEQETDVELLRIFLDEAREVVAQGMQALDALAVDAGQLNEQARLRRAFHTLKGSARMVGLDEFGEAGWALEQMLNAWLAEQKPMPEAWRSLARESLQAFAAWTQAIADGQAEDWSATPFRAAADAMRLQGERAPVALRPSRRRRATTGPEAVAGTAASAVREAVAGDAQDFAALESVMQASAQLPEGFLDAVASHSPAPTPSSAPGPAITPPGEAVPQLPAEDENVKVIEGLRIPLPLYNVYLNEADEWSSRLDAALQSWGRSLEQPLPDDAVALAHSLAGASATVGFKGLSHLARVLEQALVHVQPLGHGEVGQLPAFQAAADEIRRLLHQFAAGFLKTPQPAVEAALQQVLDTRIDNGQGEVRSATGLDAEDALWAQELQAAEAPQGEVSEAMAAEALPVPPEVAAPAPVRPDASAVAKADALPADSAMQQGIDVAIDVQDAIDPDLFPVCEEEVAELLPVLGTALRDWAAQPEQQAARQASLRALHTLKGSTRLAGALRLGEMAHRLESRIEQIGADAAHTAQIESLLGSFDTLQAHFTTLRAQDEPALDAAPVQAAAERAVPHDLPPGLQPAVFTPAAPWTSARATAQHAVRVRGQLLDRLINQSGEVLMARSRIDARLGQARSALHDLNDNLERLRQQLRDLEVQADTQMQSRLALPKDAAAGFDPLEFDRFTRVQELTRMMAESVNDVATVQRTLQRDLAGAEDDLVAQGRQARELQRDLLRTRMVEFDSLSERLHAVVRQAAKEMGKQVRLNIVGGSIEMDRGVLERMTPAFEHLLRNCVAHGIEPVAARTALGKDPSGTVCVTLQQEGNEVRVRVEDDGAGLDLVRIRATAVARGLLTAQAELTPEEAGELIFRPGFSTADEVTDVSGRGIGMDVVRAEVSALGGHVETRSTPGAGASFALVLPLTTAVTQVVMLRMGELVVGVPANLVEIVRRVSRPVLESAYANGQLQEEGGDEGVPLLWGGALWQSSLHSQEKTGKTSPVVLVRSASQRLALHVDEVLGHQEVVVKPLGPQLACLPGLTGMSVLASGAVLLIYNPVALVTVYGEQIRAQLRQGSATTAPAGEGGAAASPFQAPAAAAVPLVLVVDDSITVRRVTQRLLQREGYRVAVASDGEQALERLQGERPAVMLSDIEMPRMDGFDLVRQIRGDARLHDLPIIMVTSRMAQKHRDLARELGVNHYLGKPYADQELLRLVGRYAQLDQAPAALTTA